jgi:FKBP-type peptidyl-prolyl cis-trans isomerase
MCWENTIMRRLLWALFLITALLAIAVEAQETSELKTQKEKISYALGMQMGADFHKQGLDLDLASLLKGLDASYHGGKTLLTEDEMRAVIASAKEEYRKKQAALREEQGEANLKAGEQFLADNKSKEGVVTLPTGLEYKVIQQGQGNAPKTHQHVVCNYRGTLIDGTEFDSSSKHNGPATFPMRGVIEGWREALLMMREGAKWQLFVPPQLAYGKAGIPSMNVPPNATLIYELELIAVKESDEERDRE